MTTTVTPEPEAPHSPEPRTSEPWAQRLGQILVLRENRFANPSAWRKIRAELRRGISPHTEQYAYPYVLPWAGEDANRHRQTILLRLFALVAEFEEIPWRGREHHTEGERGKDGKKTQRQRFGQWCYRVSVARARSRGESFINDPGDPDTIAQRLRFLHTLDAEQAVLNASRILALANGLGSNAPALDYFDLFRTFLHWGNSLSPQSQTARRRLLRDYYAAYIPAAEDTAPSGSTNPTPTGTSAAS